LSSELLEIEGLGDKRVKMLLRHFGSLKRMRQASAEEIAAVAGIGESLADKIHSKLNSS
jgi:excinuclease ABC subunit C